MAEQADPERRTVVRTIDVRSSMQDAAETMAFHEVGALPVVETEVLVGIISERDLVRAVGDEADLRVTPVTDYMTPGPIAIGPGDDLATAAALMAANQTRHIPILDHGFVVGIVSARDVLTELARGGLANGHSKPLRMR